MTSTSSVAIPKHVKRVEPVQITNPIATIMKGGSPGSVLGSWMKALLGYGAHLTLMWPRHSQAAE